MSRFLNEFVFFNILVINISRFAHPLSPHDKFRTLFSPSRFTGRGWGIGPNLPRRNYQDIVGADIAELNSSTRKTSAIADENKPKA